MNSSIFVVEDDAIVANNLCDRLKGLGYIVFGIASSGEEALAQVAETQPNLVLMDIRLRGEMDGVACAMEIRSRHDIPVVYLTGYADELTLQRAKISEPYGYIVKPFELRELHSIIAMALHKHAIERQLRESEEKYRSLVERSLQGLMVIQGAPPRVLFANHACAEITGYSIDELSALRPEDTMSLVHPDDRTWLLEYLTAQLSGQFVPTTAEFRVVRRDGTLRWVEYFASLIRYGGDPAVQVAFVNITDRKEGEEALRRAHEELERRVEERTAELARTNLLLMEEIVIRQEIEQALKESETRFRNLFENAPVCIFEVDLSQTPHPIVQANRRAEEVYGWTHAELTSASWPEIISASPLDYDRLIAAIPRGEASTLESIHRRRDGSVFPVRMSAAPASSTGSQRVILTIEDISAERSRRSEEAAIAEERRRLAREIHDGLAQNLASLRLRARLWHTIIDQDPEQMHAEVDAVRALLSEQIQDVRRSVFSLRPVALDELGFFTALRQFVSDLSEQSQVRMDLGIIGPEERLPSRLEPVLFRIVQEALNNVSKHAQASTAWVVLDLTQADCVTLTIRDDGVGFDQQLLDQATRIGHLGLRQMRERIEELKGQFLLMVEPEKGTEIRIVLPAPHMP